MVVRPAPGTPATAVCRVRDGWRGVRAGRPGGSACWSGSGDGLVAPPGWGAGPSCGHPGGAADTSAGPGHIGVGGRVVVVVAPGRMVPGGGWTGSPGLGGKMLVARAGMVMGGRVCAHPCHRPFPGSVRRCWVAQAIRARRLAPGAVVRVLAAVGILSRWLVGVRVGGGAGGRTARAVAGLAGRPGSPGTYHIPDCVRWWCALGHTPMAVLGGWRVADYPGKCVWWGEPLEPGKEGRAVCRLAGFVV